MAKSLTAQIRAMADTGWDKNLEERALGTNYSRLSRRVARTLKRPRADFIATVSWKGWIPFLGTAKTGTRVACFATVQPNSALCHLSGHIDQSGLSRQPLVTYASKHGTAVVQELADLPGNRCWRRLQLSAALINRGEVRRSDQYGAPPRSEQSQK